MSALARAARVEARKLLSSRALPALAACAALLAALTMSSPAEFPGGPLLMTAGPDPSRIGGAIGFIGNVADPAAPGLSAVRTSLVYTVLASIYFSPFSPTYFRQSRQRGCAGFAYADAPLSASRLPPPSRPHRRWIRPSGGTTVPLS